MKWKGIIFYEGFAEVADNKAVIVATDLEFDDPVSRSRK